jgi:PPOX class probable F420-dependent enzyme
MPRVTAFPDSHADLLNAEFAALTTLGADGIPQTTMVWFLHENGELRISLNTTRLKTRNLRRRPECGLLILDLANPYRYLDVRGRATLEPDDDYAFADRVGVKYGGTDLRTRDAPGESRIVMTIVPTNVYAVPPQ